MAPDYPAAHSMDTSWYAVDVVGHVALFESGEDGHAPREARDAGYLFALAGARTGDGPGDLYRLDQDEVAAQIGLFVYEYGASFYPIDTYVRRVTPPHPAHVDQLPPEVRDGCKQIRLPVPFAPALRIQPMEFFACAYWYQEDRHAYLASDGVTVRPVPGREDRFPEFVRWFRETWPDQVGRYRFEGVDDGP